MKQFIIKILVVIALAPTALAQNTQLVQNQDQLNSAISNAAPGTEIVMADGEWRDIKIKFTGQGTKENPIILRAETPGKVLIKGASNLKLGGEHLIVSGLYFTEGYTPSDAVIEFRVDSKTPAFNCRVTECVIDGFNQLRRRRADRWVQFWGRYNVLDHCYLTGKSNHGPTIRVDLKGLEHVRNFHRIVNNHFGPRPPKGGPSAETIQIGSSQTSVSPSNTLVANNLFERCDGEVEIVSNKSNFNEFRNNVFFKSEGSLVMRHGNYCTIDGNYFIGDENNANIGGIRVIGTGHWVTNNYFYKLKGENFRSPLAVMNGIPKSAMNRYLQVTDAVVAYNTYIDCVSPWQFGVGANLDQKGILPASEIRSAVPVRSVVANNIIYNSKADEAPIVAYDKVSGIKFKSNLINNQGVDFAMSEKLKTKEFSLSKVATDIYAPKADLSEYKPFIGFEFENIKSDLFGNSRSNGNRIGAMLSKTDDPQILNYDKYGPGWFSPAVMLDSRLVKVSSADELVEKISLAKAGDIFKLTAGTYTISSTVKIDKRISIQPATEGDKVSLVFTGEDVLFSMNPGAKLILKNLKVKGNGTQMAFASLKEKMSSSYDLSVEGCEISNFEFVVKAYKESFAQKIVFDNTTVRNCLNGIELSEETDDKGDYSAENLVITNCTFEKVSQNVIDYYRGGYDESTVGGTLVVANSTFSGCGAEEKSGILINTYGIINVSISGNTFKNNDVEQVALLWGAKNNTHSDNVITKSGKIVVEQNLKQKLMY